MEVSIGPLKVHCSVSHAGCADHHCAAMIGTRSAFLKAALSFYINVRRGIPFGVSPHLAFTSCSGRVAGIKNLRDQSSLPAQPVIDGVSRKIEARASLDGRKLEYVISLCVCMVVASPFG